MDKESYDAIIFLGDVVDFGPSPKNCIKFLMKSSNARFWGVRGDHDHAMAYGINSRCPEELNSISTATRDWGEDYLSSEEIGFLRRLPINKDFYLNSMHFALFHGSDIDVTNFTEKTYNNIVEEEKEINFILLGHSHKPFTKTMGNTILLNPGSAGQPRDLNPRVSYDIERTVNDLEKIALPKDITSKLTSMLYNGGSVN